MHSQNINYISIHTDVHCTNITDIKTQQ